MSSFATPDYPKRREAIRTLARHLACTGIDQAITDVDHSHYPDLDPDDLDAVIKEAGRIADEIGPVWTYFREQYQRLTGQPWTKET